MENILHYFNEKIISLTENYLKSFIFEKGISGFTDDLIVEFARFGSDLTQYLVEYVEEEIFNLEERKEQLMNYILNNQEGIRNLYQNKELLHGCSAERHVSHIYSDRMSSRPIGWKTANVNNMSKLRLLKEDNITVKEILNKQEKIIDFNEYKEIKAKTRKKIHKNIYFKPASMPIISFGTHAQRKFFKDILNGMAM